MNKHLFPKAEFTALLKNADASAVAKEKAWFAIADRILSDWDGRSYSSLLDTLTPGQGAVVCCAKFHRGAAYDFITTLTQKNLCRFTLKALENIQAHEYLEMLRKLEAIFPDKRFPEYAEDVLAAYRKVPDDYFDKIADKFVTGKAMKRPLHDYIFEYVMAHTEDFIITS